MKSPVVLVTGASSGIGAALARAYDAAGARVVLLARRVERTSELAKTLHNGLALRCDVDDDASVAEAFREALAVFGRLDVVIANAGVSVPGAVERLEVEDYRRQFETNVLGVVRTAKAAIAPLRQTRGRLGVVGSLNGALSLPGFSAYTMSKFAVRAFCTALRGELRDDGVSVTHLLPGFVESEIRLREGKDPIPAWIPMRADQAAAEIVRAVEARRPEAVITGHGRAFMALQRIAPRLVDAVIERSAGRIMRSFDD